MAPRRVGGRRPDSRRGHRQAAIAARAKGGQDPHPLVIAASQDWQDRRHSGQRLTLEVLTQWLAHRVKLPYLRIDPLTLEVGKLTEVVPYAYASRAGSCRSR